MSTEIELKLSFAAEAAAAVLGSPRLRALKQGRARTEELVTTYFDTADGRLTRARVALRLRSQAGRWIQTVKAGGSAAGGVHERFEHEWTLPGPTLELQHIDDTPLAKTFKGLDASELVEVLTTRFSRTAYTIHVGEMSAEVAIDRGTIEASHRQSAINELEIELKSGPMSALYELAVALAAELPVRIEPMSKAERGWALLHRQALRPVHARPAPLVADMRLGDAARAVIGGCLAQVQANEQGFLARSDPEYLHQMRVGLRRLRVALTCFRELFDPSELDRIRTELRWLGEQLGPARDWDVWCTETLPALITTLGSSIPADALARASASARRKARATARSAVRSPRYVQLVLLVGRALAALSPVPDTDTEPMNIVRHAEKVLAKRHRSLASHREAAQTPEALHAARIAAKKLRYAAEFFAPLHKTKRAQRLVKALSRLQNVLGAMNDANVARAMLTDATRGGNSAVPPEAIARIEGWLAGSTSARLESLPAAWRDWKACERFW